MLRLEIRKLGPGLEIMLRLEIRKLGLGLEIWTRTIVILDDPSMFRCSGQQF